VAELAADAWLFCAAAAKELGSGDPLLDALPGQTAV
jgi:hypothetical protein